MCGPIRIYVQAHAYIRAGSRVYTCRLTPPYVWLTDAYMHIKKNRQLTPSAAKRPWCFQKRWWRFNKRLWCFLKTSKSFFKSPACFYVMAGGILPSLSRSFLFFRSSLHFSLNKRIINRLRMTGLPSSSFHPCLPSPFTICLQPLSRRKKYYRWKEAERGMTGCPFTAGTPIGRTFQQ